MSALTLDEAKAHLNIRLDDTKYDAELPGFIDTAEAVVASYCGPLEATEVTAQVMASRDTLLLPTVPALAVTSVVGLDGTVATDALQLDRAAGVVRVLTGALGCRAYTVAYIAGRDSVPPDLLMAIKEQLRHLWTSQRGATPGPGSSPDAARAGYLVPNRVAELMAPYQQFSVA